MGTGQHGASKQITDPKIQLWGLWRNLHLRPRPVPQTPVCQAPPNQDKKVGVLAPLLPCKLVPGSAAQRVPFTFSH